MGVHRITSLLHKQNWIPTTTPQQEPQVDAACRLWKDWNPSTCFLHQGLPIQAIPAESLLLIDGNGLAFYLFKVAYARYLRSIFSSQQDDAFPDIKSLKPSDLTKALPCMMPLNRLEDITREFSSHLRLCSQTVQVFWDGPQRRFKTVTTQKRRKQRLEEWSNLQQYCEHGSLPTNEKTVFGFLRHFPVPSLFLQCVRKTLHQEQVDMIYCQEEADVELARKASGNPKAFVLGQDSDFYFYKDIQYVSFDCIFTANDKIHACVGKREDLARLLGIQDEEMTELAILLGNDYVQSIKVPNKKKVDQGDPLTVVGYLHEQEDGFQVASKEYEVELAFVRALYNLQELDSFPLQHVSAIQDDSMEEEEDITRHLKIQLPQGLAEKVDTALQEGLTLQETVLRCLSSCTEPAFNDDESPMFGVEHLMAYGELISPSITTQNNQLERPPHWPNVRASYIIEKCISIILKSPRASLLMRLTPPSTLFSHCKFHRILASNEEHNETNYDSPPEDNTSKEEEEPVFVERKVLPIDAHEDRIIENIANNRVTIIHGETGCGKSSRVPVMLLNAPSPEPTLPTVKFFISQPRRIAAKGLVERVRSCEPDHRHKFAIRMGHGWKEYETRQTQAWFVTTGYLTRLLANHPEQFDDCTHLMIDEVHERSVDTDILCLLCRRLLERNKTIRLVLMSATLATKLYKEYFKVPNDPIHVGVRTFPITEYFVEDLNRFKLPPNEMKAAKAIVDECQKKRCNSAPTAADLSKRFSLAAHISKAVGRPGSSVLIFVPGMNEIVAITECIDNFYVAGTRYTTCPIHSDIPFDEQMEAFNEPDEDEVKIIIATNAAESSVTLPTVDHVICLGLCRQIIYNPVSHRQMLAPMWISQASAKQRAGRTGRVRPGNVYRLYTRDAFQNYMDEFDPGEISRVPLDSVILMLKEMLHEEVIPVLGNCIEPPSMDTIDRSFESLHRSNFIEEPTDEADITSLGSFVSSLGIDLALGSLIGLGIQFGVAAEAIEMAAMMSFPKTPFQITSTLFHNPAMFNEITSNGYVCRCHFDANLYSEPMSLMNALYDYDMAPDKSKWCLRYRIAIARMKQLSSTRNSLRTRVARYFGINEEVLVPESPPVLMPHAKVNILRIVQVWVFSDTIVETWPTKSIQMGDDGSVTLSIPKGTKQNIEKKHLEQVLDPERHPHDIVRFVDLRQLGHFENEGSFDLHDFMPEFQKKLVSYMIEMNVDLVCCFSDKNLYLFRSSDKMYDGITSLIFEDLEQYVKKDDIVAEHDSMMKRQGYMERKCGAWKISFGNGNAMKSKGADVEQKFYQRIHLRGPSKDFTESVLDILDYNMRRGEILSFFYWSFPPGKGKKKKKRSAQPSEQSFELIARGACQEISKRDLQDLLSSSEVYSVPRAESTTKICFYEQENQPYPFKGRGQDLFATTCNTDTSSWKRPLLKDIPEGARLLAVLASGQRRGGHRLRFAKVGPSGEKLRTDPEDTDDFPLERSQSDLARRWERLGMSGPVFVQENTVSASATNTTGPLYACCSNALEIKGGMLKVEGMTLLPSNPIFLLLSMLTFGLRPNAQVTWGDMQGADNKKSDLMNKKQLNAAIRWLQEQKQALSDKGVRNSDFDFDGGRSKDQIKAAIAFHQACEHMGETLHCFPDMILELCNLFSYVDGYEMSVWESLGDKAFTKQNLAKWRDDAKKRAEERKEDRRSRSLTPKRSNTPNSKKKSKSPRRAGSRSNSRTPRRGRKGEATPNNRGKSPRTPNRSNGTSPKRTPISARSHTFSKSPRRTPQSMTRARSNSTPGPTPATPTKGTPPPPSSPPFSVNSPPLSDKKEKAKEKLQLVKEFDHNTLSDSRHWFATTQTGAIQADDFPSTNILALIHETFFQEGLGEGNGDSSSSISLNSSKDWEVYSYTNSKGNTVYQARFVKSAIPIVPLNGRGKNHLPKWMKRHMRPSSSPDEHKCLPPQVPRPKTSVIPLANNQRVLMYESIELAVKMEAAFWLDRQFCVHYKTGRRHWYQHDVAQMMAALRKNEEAQHEV